MCKGIVRWFNNEKGYGFLGLEGSPDIFVHYSAIQREGYKTLKEGSEVEFTVETGPTGKLQAANVTQQKVVVPPSRPLGDLPVA